MKKTFIAIMGATGLMATFAATSTNTSPAVATPEIKHPWKSSISLGLTLTRGNKDTTLLNGDFLTQKKTLLDEFSLGVGGAYGQQDSTDSVNNYKGFVQWNHLFTPRFYGYLRAEGLQDRIKDIDYRVTIGPGAGYYLIKNTNTLLAAEAGIGFEAERLGDQDRMFATLRLAERFEHKFGDRARLWQSVEIIPQANRLENYVVNFEIGIETTITKTFTQRTWIVDSYANRPADGKVQNDLKIVAGVAYKF
jgi:putative salt-induced outer membrane protein